MLHIRQKIIAISEKYTVRDEYGNPRFYVVRPPHLRHTMAVGLGVTAVRIGILIMFVRLLFSGNELLAIGLMIAGNIALGYAAALLLPYRDIAIYSDESQQIRLLAVCQQNKIGWYRRFVLYDCMGNIVAMLRRPTLRSMFRATWIAETPDGQLISVAREDSLARAVLRRYLGPLFGILRTNFNFEFPNGAVYGLYNRKLTLNDQYLLDLRGDPGRTVDRRVALALGILLDTGEGR